LPNMCFPIPFPLVYIVVCLQALNHARVVTLCSLEIQLSRTILTNTSPQYEKLKKPAI
jgi:hypothetical protein